MKQFSMIVLVFCVIAIVFTQTGKSFAIPDHPRIFLSNGVLDTLKERMNQNTKQWQNLKNWCDFMYGKDPTKFGAHQYLACLALVYKVTDDPKWAEETVRWVDFVIENYKYGPIIYMTLTQICLAFDWTYDYLTPEKKAQYVSFIDTKIDEMVNTGKWKSLYDAESGNYAQGFVMGEAIAGYVLYGDSSNAQNYIDHSLIKWKGIRDFFQISSSGGGFFQGADYHDGMWQRTVLFTEAYKSVTGIDPYFGYSFFEDQLKYITYSFFTTQDGLRVFKNGDYSMWRIGVSGLRTVLLILGNYYYNSFGKYSYWLLNNTEGLNSNISKFPMYHGDQFLDLIFYDPNKSGSDISELPLYYNGSNKDGIGPIIMQSDWGNSNTFIGYICGNWYGGGHQDLDQASFQIYSNGGELAISSGDYDGYGTCSSMLNYAGRTISQNSVLIYDPNEHWDNSLRGNCGQLAYKNDGGQRSFDSMPQWFKTASEWESYRDRCELCDVLNFEHTNNYDYIFSDPTNAYNNPKFSSDPDCFNHPPNNPKISKFTRQLVYLRGTNEFVVIFDDIVSLNANFKKTWLLHTMEQPTLNGDETVIEGTSDVGVIESTNSTVFSAIHNTGKIFGKTIIPQSPTIRRIGGVAGTKHTETDYDCWVDGTNYYIYTAIYGKWRIEVSPKTASTFDNFLNVLYLTSSTTSSMPTTTLISSSDNKMKGTLILDSNPRIVLFSKDGSNQSNISYNANYSQTGKHLLTNISSGQYDIYKNSIKISTGLNSSSEGTLFFQSDGGGAFQIVRTGEAPPPPPTQQPTKTPTPTTPPAATTPISTTPSTSKTPTPPAAPQNLVIE